MRIKKFEAYNPNEDWFQVWKDNGHLNDIINKINRDSKGKSQDEKDVIATDILDDENMYGDKEDVKKSRELRELAE